MACACTQAGITSTLFLTNSAAGAGRTEKMSDLVLCTLDLMTSGASHRGLLALTEAPLAPLPVWAPWISDRLKSVTCTAV